ncbi:hypothetical protein Ancab_017139 [Ancistrocladus abbreviatus]
MSMHARACANAGKDETYDVENRQQGIANALLLSEFQDPTSGYMEDESCRIGIEVIIANHVDNRGPRFGHLFLLSRWKESFTWDVKDYSELVRDSYATAEEIEMCERKCWYSELVRSDGDNLATLTDLRIPEKGLMDSDRMVIQVTLERVFFMDTQIHDNIN